MFPIPSVLLLNCLLVTVSALSARTEYGDFAVYLFKTVPPRNNRLLLHHHYPATPRRNPEYWPSSHLGPPCILCENPPPGPPPPDLAPPPPPLSILNCINIMTCRKYFTCLP
uniref:Secreted protein n=1 Tax=Cacopsylla melanoneura TaxID=428564 RepID=A0A8D8U1R2_9HEMI